MKTNLRERLTRYQCVIRPKVHFAPEFSFKVNVVGSLYTIQLGDLMSFRAQILQSFDNYERGLHNGGCNDHINIRM